MNRIISLKQVSLIIGVLVALIILFGMWASGSNHTLTYSLPSVDLPEMTFQIFGKVFAKF
jgi:hypothetical protein